MGKKMIKNGFVLESLFLFLMLIRERQKIPQRDVPQMAALFSG